MPAAGHVEILGKPMFFMSYLDQGEGDRCQW